MERMSKTVVMKNHIEILTKGTNRHNHIEDHSIIIQTCIGSQCPAILTRSHHSGSLAVHNHGIIRVTTKITTGC